MTTQFEPIKIKPLWQGGRKGLAVQILFIIGCLTISSLLPAEPLEEEISNLEVFSNAYSLIKNSYYKEKPSKDLIRSAIIGMVKDLDPYSDVLTGQELEKLELQSVGQYVGIGVTIQNNDDRYFITQVYKNSAADSSGLGVGDEIISIDGTALSQIKNGDLHSLLQGEIDTELVVEYVRYGMDKAPPQKKVLKRALIMAESVSCFSPEKSIGVITLHQFLKHTARDLEQCLEQSTYQTLILDLRNNPGGLLISAVEVAELFLDIGDIVLIMDRNNTVVERYIARKSVAEKRPFLIVLINRFSASSAEILAGAIRDRGSGVLIGERSFGKGVVQSIYPIGNDLFVKLTTARYFTPLKIAFNGIGIEPDFVEKDTPGAKRYSSRDNIYQKALELAKSQQNSTEY